MKFSGMKFDLEFPEVISRWDEGIPLGNGSMGCLIWGHPKTLRFHLDRTDIWDRTPPIQVNTPEFTYQNLVRLAKEKNTDEIRRIFDAPYQHPAPTKLPCGALVLHISQEASMHASLKLDHAEALLKIETNKQTIQIRTVCHALCGTGMIQIKAAPDLFSIQLDYPVFGSEDSKKQWIYQPESREISQGSLKNLHYPSPKYEEKFSQDGLRILRYTQKISNDFSYGILAMVKQTEQETLIFFRVISSADGKNWIEEQELQLKEQLSQGYEHLLSPHVSWWQHYWQTSQIQLPEKMAEKQWYLTNYLFASCSREGCFPMPLQGVWTADDNCLPPWKGDYHNDLNTQLSYSHFYKAGHLKEGSCFLDFLWKLRPQAAHFAETFFGTKGICLPGVMTIDGQPLGGWPMYSLSPVQQIWLCQSFDLYYSYTGDQDFLAKKAWVYFRETALCITALLEKKEDGTYGLPVSSSPEIHDDEADAWVTPNSNYDLSLLRYFYQRLTEFAEILGYKKEQETWSRVLNKLPPLAVTPDHVLMLAPDERLEESHRHLSNAMAICPLHLIGYQKEEERQIIDATVSDYERFGTGMWVGFSFAWMSHLYAIQKNGEGAWEQLRIFWDNFCSPNGFHLNGDYQKRGYTTFHYRPFTLEANMFAADALQEMLLQTSKGRICLFPAIPKSWQRQEVAFQNFLGFGGIRISAATKQQQLTFIELTSPYTQNVLVEGNWKYGKKEIQLSAGKTWRWEAENQRV